MKIWGLYEYRVGNQIKINLTMLNQVRSETVSIWKLLYVDRPYVIPYNQRPYAWSIKNWETLWDSLFSEVDYSRFLGTVILLEDEGIGSDIQVFDGQQRLTTLTILCKAVADVLFENDFQTQAQNIKAYLLTDHTGVPRLKVSKTLRNYFETNFLSEVSITPTKGKSAGELQVFKAYEYFKKEVLKSFESRFNSEGDAFYKFFQTKMYSMEMVKLSITDIELGIEIFETVNATGKKLNASELAKNVLIKYANIAGRDLESFDEEWIQIDERLEGVNYTFVDFLHYYWISHFSYVGKSGLFGEMKSTFSNSSDRWMSFFDDMKSSSSTIENVLSLDNPSSFFAQYPRASKNPKDSSRYLRYLRCLRFVRNKSWILPIVALLDYEKAVNIRGGTFIGSNKWHKILKKHFVFSFLHFNVFSLPTRDYTPAMYRLAQKINKAIDDFPQDVAASNAEINKHFEEHFKGKDGYVAKTLKYFKDNEDEALEGIMGLRHTHDNKYLIHSVLGEINEDYLGGVFHDIPSHSIEHYMPQESYSSWGIEKNVSKRHENKLGNILILTTQLNGKLQNKSHKEKLEILKNTKGLDELTTKFVEIHVKGYGEYDFGLITERSLIESETQEHLSEIDKRSKFIANCFIELWIRRMRY